MAQQFDDALHVMEIYGGGFVKALVACYYAADSSNKAKLRAAFANVFDRYEQQFQALKAQNEREGMRA